MKYIVLINHSKTIKLANGSIEASKPQFIKEAKLLTSELKAHKNLTGLMHLSRSLEQKVLSYLDGWSAEGQGMAGWSYAGDIFKGLKIDSLNNNQAKYLNDHIIILSGLYGALKPSDKICPYRLEMGTKLHGEWGNNLYDFWRDKLCISDSDAEVVVNCASQEFFKSVKVSESCRLISPKFLQIYPDGEQKDVTIFTKQARGLYARWCAIAQPNNINDLKKFDLEGYKIHTVNGDILIFTRPYPKVVL